MQLIARPAADYAYIPSKSDNFNLFATRNPLFGFPICIDHSVKNIPGSDFCRSQSN